MKCIKVQEKSGRMIRRASVFFGIISGSLGLLEKEAGHYDRKTSFIGRPIILASSSADPSSAFVGTADGYVGKVLAKDGSLAWRRLTCQDRSPVYAIAFSADSQFVHVQCSDSSTLSVRNQGGSIVSPEDTYFSEYHYSASQVSVGSMTISTEEGDVLVGYSGEDRKWAREESLSNSTSSVIISMQKNPSAHHSKDLAWLIGDSRPILLSFSKPAQRIVAVDISTSSILWGKQLDAEIVSLSKLGGQEASLIDSSGASVGTIDPLTGSIKYLRTQSSDDSEALPYIVSGKRVYSKSWSIELSGKVLDVIVPSHTDLGSVPVLVKGDASVVFKYMNPNLVVLVSEGVYLTAIDTVTGYIVYQTVIDSANADAPIHVVLCDNWIVAHYHNKNVPNRFEVIVIDLFEKREDTGIIPIIFGQDLQSHESAFDLPTDPIAISQQYIFPSGPVTALAVTGTTKGVTPRQVLFAASRGILAIRKDIWLNPRRDGFGNSRIHPRLLLSSEESLPPYSHTLPIVWTDVISHQHRLDEVRSIKMLATHLESVSIAVALGKDLFVSPVYIGNAPYDVLSPFFNYWLLYVSVSVVVVAVSVTSVIAKRTDLNNKWK